MAGRARGTRPGRRRASPTWTTRGSSPNWPATWRGSARPGRGPSCSAYRAPWEIPARNGLLPVTGLFLVAGTALESSRRMAPVPQLRASMVLVMGTGDPTSPYGGGPLIRRGITGRVRKRRAARHGELPGEDVVAGAEAVVADWATANCTTGHGITGSAITATGGSARPSVEELPAAPGDLPVTRKT